MAEQSSQNKQKRFISIAQTFSFGLQLGLYLATPIILFLYIGEWADKKLHTTPFLLIAGVIFGFVVGMYTVYKEVSRLGR